MGMRFAFALLAFLLLTADIHAAHAGTFTLNTAGITEYNSQFGSTGRTSRGDSWYTTWASDGTLFLGNNDGQNFTTTAITNGCQSSGSATALGKINSAFTIGTVINCLTSNGTIAQTDTGGWTDGLRWGEFGMLYVNDGSTTTGLYWLWGRVPNTPGNQVNSSIMYSPDEGVTWCAPGHTGGSCNTNGDSPAANTAEFATNFNSIQFIQYEQGATGTAPVDCNPTYIYAVGRSTDGTKLFLGRVTRGTNLQTYASWSFYTGSTGGNPCTSGNWGAQASATAICQSSGGSCDLENNTIIYISGFGYLMSNMGGSDGLTFELWTAPTFTGPWTSVMTYDTTALNGGYGFTTSNPMLSSLTETGPSSWSIVFCWGGSSLSDTDNATTPYSPWFIQLSYAGPAGSALQDAVSLSGGAVLQ
jgi:hypothetical protein